MFTSLLIPTIINGFLGLGGPEVFLLLILLFLASPAVFIVWALIEVLKSNFQNDTNKLIWVLVILFVPVLGGLLYFIIGRKQRVA
jgi:hypothetical protein